MPNKKNLHIVDSYRFWSIDTMTVFIMDECATNYKSVFANKVLNRSWKSLFIEWWLHNIGYYLTKPLCHIPFFKALNKRFKDVDLEEWK